MARVSCWLGITNDHLRPDCPARIRQLPTLRRYQWDRHGAGLVDPLGPDICPPCRHWWQSQPTTREETHP